jgi:hypothetical protein
MLPTVKQEILGEAEDILKESFASTALQADLLVGSVNQVQNGVEEKGQKIEGEQEAGQMVLPVSKIVF